MCDVRRKHGAGKAKDGRKYLQVIINDNVKKVEKIVKKLAISFVTYNRAKHIREDLFVIAQPTKQCDIDIYIYDGSTNIQTERVVKEYIQRGYDHIHYFHTDKQISVSDSACQRAASALLVPNAEYVWLCGDKFVINPEHYFEILSYIDEEYDIITIYGYPLKGTRSFNKASKFAKYAIVPITHHGSTIIKKKWIETVNVQGTLEEAPGFGVLLTYLRGIANIEGFKGIVIDKGQQARIISRHKTPSASMSCMWEVWVVKWCHFIELLPSAYEDIREELYNRVDLQLNYFSLKELLRQRSEDQYNWKKYWECREYVKKVIVMPGVFVFCISLLPRSVAKWLWTNYEHGEKICSWMKNGVRLIGEKL